MARHRTMSRDRRTEIALTGVATRLAVEMVPEPEAVERLRDLSHGRSDLLAEAAGGLLGAWLASPGTQHPGRVRAAWLLLAAGADPDAVPPWVDVARGRLAHATHGTTGGVDGLADL